VEKLARTVVHYGPNDPRTAVGGVEAFARNLGLLFEGVEFMTPRSRDFERVRAERLPVICDNHWVRDVPSDIPAIGFQHGVAREKVRVTRNLKDAKLAYRQMRAARRANTLWVACAEWISEAFGTLHGNRASHIVYHPVDLERFDGRLDNAGSNLVLHDARSEAKGRSAVQWLAEAFPAYRFEPLACAPSEVPDRMRKAAAFVHLSKYEGNSIVCNEAMASDLPCLFSRVGLMRDAHGPTDVAVVDTATLRDRALLVAAAGGFFASLGQRTHHPRAWMLEHASPKAARARWADAMHELDGLWGRG
jgi:hypothetical protein